MFKPSGKKAANSDHATKAGTTSLVLGATGVVFGDIGTSPIYAFMVSKSRIVMG